MLVTATGAHKVQGRAPCVTAKYREVTGATSTKTNVKMGAAESGVPTLKVLVQRLRYPLDLPRRDPIWPPRQDIGIVQEGHVDARLFPMADQTRHLFTATPMPCLPHPKAISIMQSSTELRQSALRSEEVIGCPKVVANVGKSLVRAMHSGMKEWKVLLY